MQDFSLFCLICVFVVGIAGRVRQKNLGLDEHENPFARHILDVVHSPNDVILFDTQSIRELFDNDVQLSLGSSTSWHNTILNIHKSKTTSDNKAIRLFNTVEIGDVFQMLLKNDITIESALSRSSLPIVLVNGGGENWGLLSTGIGTRTAWWVNLTEHLENHGASYETVRALLASSQLTLLVCSAHVDPAIGAHSKIISLPIGVRRPDVANLYQLLQIAYDNNVTKSRIILINNSGVGDRAAINAHIAAVFNHTINNEYSTDGNAKYYDAVVKSKFVLCPSGIGMDSFRIWESLLLGAIPVVESNAGLDRTYSHLPVLVVNNYSDITPHLLSEAYQCFRSHAAQFRYQHLTQEYWLHLVAEAVRTASVDHVTINHPFRNPYCDYLREHRIAGRNQKRKSPQGR